jgi:hypothetical protein
MIIKSITSKKYEHVYSVSRYGQFSIVAMVHY